MAQCGLNVCQKGSESDSLRTGVLGMEVLGMEVLPMEVLPMEVLPRFT